MLGVGVFSIMATLIELFLGLCYYRLFLRNQLKSNIEAFILKVIRFVNLRFSGLPYSFDFSVLD